MLDVLIGIYTEQYDRIKALIELNDKWLAAWSESFELDSLEKYMDEKQCIIDRIDSLAEKTKDLLENINDSEVAGNQSLKDIVAKVNLETQNMNNAEMSMRKLIEDKLSESKSDIRAGRTKSRAAMNYYRVQSNTSVSDSFFMDQKK